MKKINLLLVLLIALNTNVFSQSFENRHQEILHRLRNPSKNYVLAVAHRGAWSQAPENSLLAVQRCIDLGIDIAEIDVRLTKDGHLVLMHDLTVNRTTNGKKRRVIHIEFSDRELPEGLNWSERMN